MQLYLRCRCSIFLLPTGCSRGPQYVHNLCAGLHLAVGCLCDKLHPHATQLPRAAIHSVYHAAFCTLPLASHGVRVCLTAAQRGVLASLLHDQVSALLCAYTAALSRFLLLAGKAEYCAVRKETIDAHQEG